MALCRYWCSKKGRFALPAQPVDATHALNPSAIATVRIVGYLAFLMTIDVPLFQCGRPGQPRSARFLLARGSSPALSYRSGGDVRCSSKANISGSTSTATLSPRCPAPKFQGGYAEAAYVLTGETRHYNPGSAAFGGIVPASPLSLTGGGWGAWEIAGRVSTIDRNDQLATANGFVRGRQANYTAALNWYVNRNGRLMFDYLHGDVAKQISGTNAGNAGSKFDAFAMRNQAAFWGICMQICGCCPRAVRGNATARPRIGREIRRRICTCLM